MLWEYVYIFTRVYFLPFSSNVLCTVFYKTVFYIELKCTVFSFVEYASLILITFNLIIFKIISAFEISYHMQTQVK